MKYSIRDKAEGTFLEMRGKLQEVTGRITDNRKWQVKGSVEKVAGKVQDKVGQVKQVFGM
jgi:uncharacterized protein YjbJ (UPF0337 family)